MFCTVLIDGFIIIPFYVLRHKSHFSLDVIDVFQPNKKTSSIVHIAHINGLREVAN